MRSLRFATSRQPTSRYDFLKDIRRLEDLAEFPRAKAGVAIFLTNEHLYWKEPTRRDTVDAAFRLHEDRRLRGEMAWSERASAGTMKGREDPIRLEGSYEARWRTYGNAGGGRHGEFRYLAIRTAPSRR